MDRSIAAVLAEARHQQASDVLFRENHPIFLRIRGELLETKHRVTRYALEELQRRLCPPDHIREYLGPPASEDATLEENGRYRVNFFTSLGERCMVARVISPEVAPLKSLGMPEGLPDRVWSRKGLSLIVGKTGAGKSTTMAAILQELLAKHRIHLITLEDPVEYRMEPGLGQVTQRELGRDFSTFESGIFEALRQSPDFIAIGEIRTLSALRAAITAAESGHGVLSTMHSFGAAKTLTRMLAMVPEAEKELVRYQLSAQLNFIHSQDLSYPEGKLHRKYELMLNLPSVENTIREGRFHQIDNLIRLGEKQGMRRQGLDERE
ncbi:Flp pilus assembly complex ATPase component TadA [Proteiniclasticum sp. BAD-10]|uniref:Flp pilus assembly complex ATPase component TadA n=1 Tax=Proteiniclasticum sediminis TaxID=2804028 RepID=A0A941HPK9_9CLOT|nr:ATPase, T2SS/T4P/T4SS family [Proteiniclasticum sediminis]MBR0575546.1 Flp pilus assembly complex ATPase component TadA [Proteiniclasticum sediminis]